MRRTLAVVAAVALLGVAGAASGAPPNNPGAVVLPVPSKARLLVSGVVGNGFFVHYWDSPSSTGRGRCYFETVSHSLATGPRLTLTQYRTDGSGAGSCSPRLAALNSTIRVGLNPFRSLFSWAPLTRDHNSAEWIPPHVVGEVMTASPPARVVLRWSGGATTLGLRGRWFAGGSVALYNHMPAYSLIAYDQSGRVLARFTHT